jgi:acetyl-CoA synthetase
VPEPEDEPPVAITYQELLPPVNEFAALLRDFAGVKTGDRVTFTCRWCPSCRSRCWPAPGSGVIHSEVFGGFSGAACGTGSPTRAAAS